MKYRRLGHSGLEVSAVCLGMMSYGSPAWQPWVLPGDEATGFVRQALERGINAFDTADFYSHGASEEALGIALRQVAKRHEVVIATKAGLPMGPGPNRGGLSRKHLLASVDASLRRLQTDHVDLFQLHRADPHTPLEETLDALDHLVRTGRALHVGASNHEAWQIAPAVLRARTGGQAPLASMQIQYNLAYREAERDLIPLCTTHGVGLLVYSPLARGWLAGNRLHGSAMSEREALRAGADLKAHALYGNAGDVQVAEQLGRLAAARGVPPARLAMAWLQQRPGIASVICGALEPQHIEEACLAVELVLGDEECRLLESAYQPQAIKHDAFQAVLASGVPA